MNDHDLFTRPLQLSGYTKKAMFNAAADQSASSADVYSRSTTSSEVVIQNTSESSPHQVQVQESPWKIPRAVCITETLCKVYWATQLLPSSQAIVGSN